MPLRGQGHSDLVRDEVPFFRSLAELDAWFARPHAKLSGVLPYRPRPAIDGQSDSSRGKLLVCHDYKGGYSESPSGLCYTFNFWPLCDTFVYFSHNRVTVPPSGWTNAAHRHGTLMLGTLLFEGLDAQPDCLHLVVGLANCVVTENRVPISERYAVLLAELAYQRGFDGYLLNFESDLPHGTDHARALGAWILLLRAQLRTKVGPHAQVMWYDSVIYEGHVWHQNRLNGYNLPFFLAADTFFTNYWWLPETLDSMAHYFWNLNSSVLDPSLSTDGMSLVAAKTPQTIYSGVDVWPGRGQYGNSGFCCYRAITHSCSRGFSTALFAPGWTWESATEKPEKNWHDWWDNERKLWLGPLTSGEVIPVPDSPEGLFKPMTTFFPNLPHPDPFNFMFYTHFSPGVGYSWFVGGKKVLDTKEGWTDIDKQGSIGNLVWPWPTPTWQGIQREEAPTTSSTLDMTDGYNGGNALKLTLTYAGSASNDTAQLIWLPVQSLAVTTQESLEACVVYKTISGDDVDLDSHIYVKPLSKDEGEDDLAYLSVGQTVTSDLPHGWTRQTIHFASASSRDVASVAIGLLVGFRPKDPFVSVTFSLSLGQLAVYPTPPSPPESVGSVCITGVKFVPIPQPDTAPAPKPPRPVEGVLTWDTASTLDPIVVQVDDEESTTPAWPLQDTPAYRVAAFAYFNVYAAPLDRARVPGDPAAVFLGTTGLDGRANRFFIERACFPPGWAVRAVRFYVQGVTDRGEVLPWKMCATVDYKSAA